MGLLMCYKNTMMLAPQRIAVLIPLLASDAVHHLGDVARLLEMLANEPSEIG